MIHIFSRQLAALRLIFLAAIQLDTPSIASSSTLTVNIPPRSQASTRRAYTARFCPRARRLPVQRVGPSEV
ncbi:hypothetical protein BX600DRAFT_472213 [Xylariales sp. PMI_506]|nr:hypothetical protein BX600DRAFT_472213 [Xylariales sp. PMI_506]